MFRKILYPTDFSDCAVKALEYVKKLKEAGAEEVVVVYVIDVRDLATMSTGVAGFGETPVTYDYEVQEMMIANVKKKLEELKTEIETVGLKVAVKMPEGVPRKEILKTAEEENVSLIVLGSHGKSNVKELLLGSVSEKVIRYFKGPVLVIKRDEST
ncbi:Nucleotide-binding universal stress protein, UspA family [Methanophagales archaeon]|nr:Nucleotide-binding universal stress protein, UspA family [Methanophagales archaeon]